MYVNTYTYQAFPTRMVYLYISCLRYTILVRNPRYAPIHPVHSPLSSPSPPLPLPSSPPTPLLPNSNTCMFVFRNIQLSFIQKSSKQLLNKPQQRDVHTTSCCLLIFDFQNNLWSLFMILLSIYGPTTFELHKPMYTCKGNAIKQMTNSCTVQLKFYIHTDTHTIAHTHTHTVTYT